MKSPIAVRNLTTPIAMPVVSVARIIEQTGSERLMKGQGSGILELPGIERLARRAPDRSRAPHAVFAPLQIKCAGCFLDGLAVDQDHFRLGPAVDLGNREKLPFPGVREILLGMGFTPDVDRHVY
jgi:hypothetical protein